MTQQTTSFDVPARLAPPAAADAAPDAPDREAKQKKRFSVIYFGLIYVYTLLFNLLSSIPLLDRMLQYLPQPQALVSDTYQPISDKVHAPRGSSSEHTLSKYSSLTPRQQQQQQQQQQGNDLSFTASASSNLLSSLQQNTGGLPLVRRRRASSLASSSTVSSISRATNTAGLDDQVANKRQNRYSMPASSVGSTVPSSTNSTGSISRNLKKKTLVLDLDETLIHSSPQGSYRAHHRIEVVIDKVACLYYVYKRPHVDYFLRKVSEWYKVVIFTASLAEYADPVIDLLDSQKKYISARYFRESCIPHDTSYAKDLAAIDQDLSQIVLIDNSPLSYFINPTNGIPIQPWVNSDPKDEALLDLLPLLDALRFTDDVRSILSLRIV
ncbi:Nuclear envelope morphology protein 1 [Dipsacomyces acuminosporus]|nr:Nuclear envelope morphology protein 1 [Dipsacomyces acuminosporus]